MHPDQYKMKQNEDNNRFLKNFISQYIFDYYKSTYLII